MKENKFLGQESIGRLTTSKKIELSARMAYGFRNIENLISMIMLRCGGMPVSLP